MSALLSEPVGWLAAPQPARPGPRVAYAPGVWLVPRGSAMTPEPAGRVLPHRDWHARAACLGHPEHDAVFFGTDEADRPTLSPSTIEAARALCRGCPVRRDCLTWALETRHEQANAFVGTGEEFGIWAGTTGRQRAKLQKRRRAGATTRELVDECLAQ